jgi:photosystem II stability/assembly factor-like uncharacterized protein
LLSPNVYDLVMPSENGDVVFAAASDDVRRTPSDGVYRSTDGALTWALAHAFRHPTATGAIGFVGCLATATDDPCVIYAAGTFAVAWTEDGGDTWTESVPSGGGSVDHVALGLRRPDGRRVYACGDRFWCSSDGGLTWEVDPGGPRLARVGSAGTSSARSLAVHPHDDLVVYVMKDDLTLWKGVFAAVTGPAVWTQLPPPPIAGGSDSGCTFVIAHAISSSDVVLYVSDRRSVHATMADPASSFNYSLVDGGVHLDPHGLALTPDFHPWAPDARPPTWGRALLVNDGGAVVSTDGTQVWSQGRGLATLNAANVAVNTSDGGSAVEGGSTAITFGGGDNLGFSSSDGGVNWLTQAYIGGDNDCSYADPRDPTRMLMFAPRSVISGTQVKGELYLFVSPDAKPPDTADGTTQRQRIPAPITTNAMGTPVRAWNVVSWYCNYGYRPLVLTRDGETPRPDGDFVTIRWKGAPEGSASVLLRTTALSSIAAPSDWDTSAVAEAPGVKVFQVGPELPNRRVGVVQASGGHEAPTFYVSDVNGSGTSVWKLAPGAASWREIVPFAGSGVGPSGARRFFVDPYRPNCLYVLADDHVYRSDDGGEHWTQDVGLDRAVTDEGAFPRSDLGSPNNPADLRSPNPAESVLRDMQFDPIDREYRLALGIAGVFLTRDGATWTPILRSSAVSLQPTSMVYDPMACERTLYVGTMGRGVLRLRPLPPDWTFPVGSLQATRGRIVLLRVHDVGTRYGPSYDSLDVEVVVWLDSEPEKTFGMKLRRDADGPAAAGMLDVLRDCFRHDRPVQLDFVRTGCRSGEIVRVIEST